MKPPRSNPLGMTADSAAAGLPDPIRSKAKRGAVTWLDRWLVRRFAMALGRPAVSIALWNGENVYRPQAPPVGRIVFADRGALVASLTRPELNFGDCFCAGRIEITGDLVGVLHECHRSITASVGPNNFKRTLAGRLPRARRNSSAQARDNIHHHYDLGNAFYALWLDKRLSYTCAYYPSADATLEAAQLAKMDHICRKLRLGHNDVVVEAGCGWGSLAVHIASRYGARVRAYNISHEQIIHARESAVAAGVGDRVEFIEDDYRNISGRYTAFVSVGMLEHVGREEYRTLGEVIARCLAANGRGLIHSVGRSQPAAPNEWLERRIFPGSYPPSLGEMMDVFEPFRFSVVDVENLRLHYAKTLVEWLRRFDDHIEEIREMYDETFVRAWRLYLAGCAGAFMANSLQLYQVVFTPPENNSLALTRAHIYDDSQAEVWTQPGGLEETLSKS